MIIPLYSVIFMFNNNIIFTSSGDRMNSNFRYFSSAANNIDSNFYRAKLAENSYVRGKVALFSKIMTESPPGRRGQTRTGIAHLLFVKKYNMKIHSFVDG